MGNKLYEESSIQAIANAIRSKLDTDATYKVEDMPLAVSSIPTGVVPTGTLNVASNGDYDVTNFAQAHVAVPSVTPTGKKTITVNGIDIDVSQFQYADVLIKGIPNNMTATQVTIDADTYTLDVPYDADREPFLVLVIPRSTQGLRYEYLFFLAKRSYAHMQSSDLEFNQIMAVSMNSQHTDDSMSVSSNAGTAVIDTTNHIITLTTRTTAHLFKQGDIFDIFVVYTTDKQNSVQVNTDLQSVGKPVVPQTGTWQYNKTWGCGFIIISKDDNEDLAKFTRMMRSYSFPYTINTTHQHYDSIISSDADTSASTAAQAFNSYIDPVVPNGGIVKNIIDALQNYRDMANIEISMNGTVDELLWDSSLLTGTVLDDYYTTYTAGGGTKTKEEFKEAVMTTYASRDISQGASILESKRNAFGVTYNMFPTSLSCWTGTFNIIIDNINCGTSTAVAADSSTIARSLNWYADTSFNDEQTAIIQDPYSIRKVAFEDISNPTEFINIVNWAVQNRTAVEFYSKTNFLDGTQEKYEAFGEILSYLYERYDEHEDVYFCTRKQYYAFGKFYPNPITSLSLTVNTSVHYPTYIEVPDSAFTCTANFKDGSSSACEDDKWIHKEAIDINTPGTYSVPLEYRGLFTNANLLIESPPVISYLVENFSDTISGSLNANQLYGTLSSQITFNKNKRYRLTCHIKMGTYTAVYANHNLEFWLPDQYNNKHKVLTHYKSTDIQSGTNVELDLFIEGIFTSDYWTDKFLRVSWLNSSVSDLEITNGYIAEVGWTNNNE